MALACRVNICILKLPGDDHLFEDHELIQEVDALAGEELPDGLLSPECARVGGGAELERLVLQEVGQREILQGKILGAQIIT